MNWVLLAVIVLFVVGFIIGCVKGLVKMIFPLLSLLVILGVPMLVAPRLAPALKERTTWYDAVLVRTEQYLSEHGMLMQLDEEKPISDKLEELWLPNSLKEKIQIGIDEYVDRGVTAYNEYLVGRVSDSAFSIMIYAGVLVATAILILIFWIVLNAMSKLPGLREVNRFGGGVLGLLDALLLVELLIVVVTALAQTNAGSYLNTQIQSNGFLEFLYDTNPILLLVAYFS